MIQSQPKLPPGRKGAPFIGQLFSLMQDPLAVLEHSAREYGDVSVVQAGPTPLYLLTDPEHIKDLFVTSAAKFKKGRALEQAKWLLGEGLLTSEGDFHLRQRRLMQPAFHRQRIMAYGATMATYARRMADTWQDGQAIDLDGEMNRLTLAIAAKTLFNADVEGEAAEIGQALTTVMENFNFYNPFSTVLDKLPVPSTLRRRQAIARLDETVYRIIHERRASGDDFGDLLSMLMQARDEESGGGMTDQQLRDEAMTIFLAGHETTANALTWTLYLLSQHPEIEARLQAEVDQALSGRLPTFEDLAALPYTRMVLSESMRVFPPVWAVGRRALEPHTFGAYTVPKDGIVLVSQWVTHKDPRFYPDPQRFDPERWTPEQAAGRPKFSYFPFGGGPRVCMGEQFAWMEGVLILAALAQQWRFRLAPGHPVATRALITLRPRHGMRLVVSRRGEA